VTIDELGDRRAREETPRDVHRERAPREDGEDVMLDQPVESLARERAGSTADTHCENQQHGGSFRSVGAISRRGG
jgi:hypothetical protein